MKTVPIPVSAAEDDIIRIWLKKGHLDRIIGSMGVEASHNEAEAIEIIKPVDFVKSSFSGSSFELPIAARNKLHDAFKLKIAIEELKKFLDENHPIYGFLQIDQ